MTNKQQKIVAIFTPGQGHKSITDAITEAVSQDTKVEIFYDNGEKNLFSYYLFIYKFFPFLNSVPFLILKNDFLQKIAEVFIRNLYQEKIATFLKNKNPDVIINSFWMFRPALDTLLTDSKKIYINVVADTWSAHPFIASPIANINFTFDKKTATVINPQRKKLAIEPAGWFVRQNFEKKINKQEVRKKLDLSTEKLTFLFTAGSEGTEQILPIIKNIYQTNYPAQLIVACGNNQELLEKVELINKENKPNVTIKAIPFTKKLHLYMHAADLVVGKAGPNSVFEAIATLTPFFATTHIAGQEDGNLEIIKTFKVGFVEEKISKASQKLIEILQNPESLDVFSQPLQDLADYNKQSKNKLRKFLKANLII